MEQLNEPVPVPALVWLPEVVGLADVPQHTPRSLTAAPPSEVTSPPETADVLVMPVTSVVLTTGAAASSRVVKLLFAP